jgi:hypothetical protein
MALQSFDFSPRTVLFAGLAGGSAEIAWVAAYASLAPASGFEVARGVTQTLVPGAGELGWAVMAGIAIHMALSMALAWLLAKPLLQGVARRFGEGALLPAALAALAAVWAINFLVVLPVLNPAFVELLPVPVSLASKLLFGAALASVLRRNARLPQVAR